MTTIYRSLLVSILVATQVAASPIPDFPFTVVDGSATKDVPPDMATIWFTVLCHDPSSEVAVATVNQVLTTVVDGVAGLGISKGSIVANDLLKEAVREKGDDFRQLKILGYDVSREVKVTISEIERYSAVARLIMATDNTTKILTEFDIKNRDDIEATLMATACADAKIKAELLCKSVGAELGDVFAISDQDFTGFPGKFGFDYGTTTHFGGGGSLPFGHANEIPVFVPAKIQLKGVVNVLYRLESATKREQGAPEQPSTRPLSK